MSAVAVIPARGGSKRIPFKNGKDFCGRPMISWPISAALKSGVFDRVVVSTDSEDLAQIARETGAETPFMRSPELADDYTGTKDVIADAATRLNLPDNAMVACLYATAAFVTPDDLRCGATKLDNGATWVMTMGDFPAPIDRCYRRSDGGMVPRWPEHMPKRSQDLEPAYYDAGQVYFARAATWSDPNTQIWDGADAIMLPRRRCVDIDTPDDWDLAEALFKLEQG